MMRLRCANGTSRSDADEVGSSCEQHAGVFQTGARRRQAAIPRRTT
eukprot:CAMPEP_0113993742 /NCGR_PEP_ID=MMETSP0328-20130328/10303_1 /TAXON_ID=39455 /ORGANISM="Alexandrium minutum" /LENGTH=45 /assembly_acc=CAM_ASM_000350